MEHDHAIVQGASWDPILWLSPGSSPISPLATLQECSADWMFTFSIGFGSGLSLTSRAT